jgi:Esterase/lipase
MWIWILTLVIVFLALFFLWNAKLWFYKDRNTEVLQSDESKCFSPKCRSIVYNENRDRAVLMIHGFPTTPQMYSDAASDINQSGWDVYAPLIPSFGTDCHEFTKTEFSQWFRFVDDYYLNLRKQYRFLTVLGVSMGGAMTLKLGEKYVGTNEEPDALVAISAPVIYNNLFKGIITSRAAYFGRTAALFKESLNARCSDHDESQDDGAEEWTGYRGTYMRQGVSLVWNLKFIHRDLKKITEPIFLMHDRNDKTVPFGNLKEITERISSETRVVCPVEMKSGRHSHHSLLMYRSVEKDYVERILYFLEAIYDRKTK